ncbi:MAG: ATPase [Bacteroidetes bacterium]|nr:ATPase [Bacteroidota bacterium]
MILIADSGSTKTSWFYSDGENHPEKISTLGINPFFRTTKDIVAELQKDLIPKVNSGISEIYFYGAGVINEEKGAVIKFALHKLYPSAKIEVYSDLLAAARATLGKERGIACILGTGSNSCLYNGKDIAEQVSPLGFILGDEGSGAVLGRKLVGDYLKGIMPENISQKFQKQYPFSYSEILENVYKKEKPNKFLARFVPFLNENKNDGYCNELVENSFNEFIQRNVKQYSDFNKLEISFVGSVAYFFQEQLKSVLSNNKLKLGVIVKEPLEGLTQYHLNK